MDPDEKVEGIFQNAILAWLLRQLDVIISDSEATRGYILRIMAPLEDLAERTANKWDDAAVDGLVYVVKNDEAWAFAYAKIYMIYQAIVNGDEDDQEFDLPGIEAEAEEVGLDPVTIIAIISAAIKVFTWWRNRRGGA